MEKNQNSLTFKNHYKPVRSFLPLYEKISPKNAYSLFSDAEFINIVISFLFEVQRFKRSKQSFFQRLLGSNSIFLVSGQKASTE